MKAPTQSLPASILTKQQYKSFGPRAISGYGPGAALWVHVRYDDNCGNGHNTFAITGTVKAPRPKGHRGHWNNNVSGGCLHEEIARVFPELAPLIKWHLTSSDGPTHYVANTLYHASDSQTPGKAVGTPTQFEERVHFAGFPMTFKASKALREWMKTNPDVSALEPVPVPYVKRQGETYDFKPKYTLTGLPVEKWHESPFDDERSAWEWIAAMGCGWQFIQTPTVWIQAKERDLDSARSSAVWPEATNEELCQDAETLKAALLARLPALMEEFQKAMTSDPLNFVY